MQDLIKMMTNAGVSEREAERRASEYTRDQENNDRFEKALTALDGVAEAQREAEEAQYDRMSKVHAAMEETTKQLGGGKSAFTAAWEDAVRKSQAKRGRP